MKTVSVALKKQTAFRLSPELVERLKTKAEKEHRSLNNYVEMVLMSAVEDEPNEVTASAIRQITFLGVEMHSA